MMHSIYKIKFNHYKGFENVAETEMNLLEPICLVIGRNNSGKSSLIDIVEYIYNEKKIGKFLTQKTDVQLAFILSEDRLSAFDMGTYGGEIGGNHRAYARQFLGKTIWTKCYSKTETSYTGERYAKRILEFVKIEDKAKEISVRGKSQWERTAQSYDDYTKNVVFRRINAERDVVAESESKEIAVGYNGEGTTNLIRCFINDSSYDEKKVEELLLRELNKIMGQDGNFENIRVQQVAVGSEIKWEIFLQERGQNRFALSQSGSGLKTIVLMLVNLWLIPELSPNRENHLYMHLRN